MTPPAGAVPARSWVVWGVGVSVYFLAVFHRTSLGVAGLLANERFHINAGQLAVFTMLQLVVYAGMQVPVGLLVDRFGSRSVLSVGIAVMSLAQCGFALATSYGEALAARGLVGVGDAMTFICVLRLVSSWFPLRRVALLSQLTGNVGQLGAIVAAIPLSWALGHLGWTKAYLCASAAGVVVFAVLVLALHDTPDIKHHRGEPLSLSALRSSLQASWFQPGTRLGFWIHFATPFSGTTMGLLWGYPFLVKGEHLSGTVAGALLTVLTFAGMLGGPVLGWLAGRHPWHRSTMALSIVAAIVACWSVVLLWHGDAPVPMLGVLFFVTGIGAPASMIGFDVGRTSNPQHRLASASGIINQAGFVASLLVVVLVGGVLDWRSPGGYTPSAFHWALSVQYVFWVLGAVQIWRYRVRVRTHVARDTVDAGSTMVELSLR